jgi:RES domain
MRLPPVTAIDSRDTHRLVPSRYSPRGESVLVRIADPGDEAHLAAIFELDGATNDRLLAEHGLLPGIGPDELVFAVPLASVINAAFCHAHPLGSRFAGPDRGAWYAGFEIETAHAEVAFHKSVELAEIGTPDESITYDDYQADFAGPFHDLRGTTGWSACLSPTSYVASQTLAARLLEAGALGIVYPSVRRAGGTCLACFRPALVGRVRRAGTWRFTWKGGQGPRIEAESDAARRRSRAPAAGRSRRRAGPDRSEHDRGGD